jgi:hypothetical protein
MHKPLSKAIFCAVHLSVLVALDGCSTTTQRHADDVQVLDDGCVASSIQMANLGLETLHRLQINDIAGLRTSMEGWLVGDVFGLWESIQDQRTAREDRDEAYRFLRLMAIQDEKFPVAEWNSDPRITAIFQAALENDPVHTAWLRRQNWNKPKWVERVD